MDRLAAMDAFVRVVDAGSFSGATTDRPALQRLLTDPVARPSVNGGHGRGDRDSGSSR